MLYSHAADRIFESDDWRLSIAWQAGVDLFFVISGFVMTLLAAGKFGSIASARSFLARRIIRIVPAYWFFTILVAAVVTAYPDAMPHARVNATTLATSLGFIPWPRVNGQVVPLLPLGWTLNYEAFFYVCFGVALLSRRGAWLLPVAFVSLVSMHLLFRPENIWAAFYLNPIIVEFLLGMAIGAAYVRRVRLKGLQSLVLVGLAIGAALLLRNQPERLIAFGIPAALLTAAAALVPQRHHVGRIESVGLLIGDASYILYLSHLLIVHATWRVGELAGVPQIATFIAAVGSSVVFAVLFHRSVERPILAALRARFAG